MIFLYQYKTILKQGNISSIGLKTQKMKIHSSENDQKVILK